MIKIMPQAHPVTHLPSDADYSPATAFERLMNADFRLGERLVQPRLLRVRCGNREQPVEPKVMRVLVRLAAAAGDVVTREELFASVWPDAVVGEDVLSRTISEIRKLFDDDSRRPRVVETIRTSGYRLLLPAECAPLHSSATPFLETGQQRRWPRSALAGAAVVGALAWTWLRPVVTSVLEPSLTSRPLTTYRGLEWAPALSPDGERVAFSWTGARGDEVDLYVKTVEEETPRRLTRAPGDEEFAAWSPDGQHIAFLRTRDGGWEVASVPAAGGTEQLFARGDGYPGPGLSWSPDGGWLAVSLRPRANAPLALSLVSSRSEERHTLTTPPEATYGDTNPAFSPDGRHIAFARSRVAGIKDVYIVPTAGGVPRRLTHDDRKILGLDWTPGGAHIVFASNRQGAFELWKVAANGGQPQRLAVSTGDAYYPSVARQESRLVFEQPQYEVNVWRTVVGAGPSAPDKALLTSTRWDAQARFSPDGQRLAFASNRSGSTEIWVCDAAGQNPERLTSFDGPLTLHPSWSPDGRSVAFETRVRGDADVYVVSAEGGTPRRLTDSTADEVMPSWSGDGSWVYYASNRGRQWQVFKTRSEGGATVQVTQNGGYRALEIAAPAGPEPGTVAPTSSRADSPTANLGPSPTHRVVVFSKRAEDGLWSVPTGGGPETRVAPVPAEPLWGTWLADPSGVVFWARPPNSARPALYALHGERPRLLTPLPENAVPPFTLSPDGRVVLYTRVDRREGDLILLQGL